MKTATRKRSGPNWTEPHMLLRATRERTLSVRETAIVMRMSVPDVKRTEAQALVKFYVQLKAWYARTYGGGA